MQWSNGIAFFEYPPIRYDLEYFNKYLRYEQSEMGVNITKARVALVMKYHPCSVLDIGIGSGHFLKELPISNKAGIDINEYALQLIRERGWEVKQDHYEMMTFWDSLEHIVDHHLLIEKYCPMYIAMTLPIFEEGKVYESKHFRPGEHFWYFTHSGIIYHMGKFGYSLLEYNDMEQKLGREEVWTYVFSKNQLS